VYKTPDYWIWSLLNGLAMLN